MSTETSKPYVLIVTDVPFWLHHRGSSRRIEALLEFLKSFCDVSVCFTGELKIIEWSLGHQKIGCELFGPGMPGKVAGKLVGQLGKIFPIASTNLDGDSSGDSLVQVELANFDSPVISQYVCDQVEARQPDMVLLEYITMSYLCDCIGDLPLPPTIMIDTHDLMYVRSNELGKQGLENWLKIEQAEEIAALEKSDYVLAIQEDEAQEMNRQLHSATVITAKHPATTIGHPQIYRNEAFVIGMVGSRGDANLISLKKFLKHCWPSVIERCPQVNLKICGRISNSDFEDLTSDQLTQVEFVGGFDDLADFYSQIDVAINPAVIASGFKIKSLEAISYSVPLVATSAGMAGLAEANECCALLSADWESFADNLLKFANDPQLVSKFAANCQNFIETEFAPSDIFADLKKAVLAAGRKA